MGTTTTVPRTFRADTLPEKPKWCANSSTETLKFARDQYRRRLRMAADRLSALRREIQKMEEVEVIDTREALAVLSLLSKEGK